jgi:hypothetical protein
MSNTSRKTCPLCSTHVRLLSPAIGWWLKGYCEGIVDCAEWHVHDGSHDAVAEVTPEFGAAQFSSVNYFLSGFIFLLWCGRPASYMSCGQLYCSCICNCDWIERLRLICNFATGWWLGCDCATTSSYAQWRGHVISHCPVVQVAATCWILVPLRCLTCLSIRSRRRHLLIVAGIMGSHQRCRLSLLTLRYAKP